MNLPLLRFLQFLRFPLLPRPGRANAAPPQHALALVVSATLWCCAAPLAAQPVPRTDFTLHIYTDSTFGDDQLATAQNPTPGALVGMQPLDVHPEAGAPKPITGWVQHAPYSFRTLTGPLGAIAYANSFGHLGTPTGWTNPNTGNTVHWIVIHCLPGLYGPGTDVDPNVGLRYNNESWPLLLPDRVSLQGTSSLETIFDARHTNTAVVVVDDGRSSTFSHAGSFIDSIMIRGARSDHVTPGSGAGIFVSSHAEQHPSNLLRITNCVIVDNIVGIGLDSFVPNSGEGVPQRVRIVNNTIAWNVVGVWAGRIDTSTGLPYPGNQPSIHAPLVLNNIFDSGDRKSVV